MLSHTNIVPKFECTLMRCGQYQCAFACMCVSVRVRKLLMTMVFVDMAG